MGEIATAVCASLGVRVCTGSIATGGTADRCTIGTAGALRTPSLAKVVDTGPGFSSTCEKRRTTRAVGRGDSARAWITCSLLGMSGRRAMRSDIMFLTLSGVASCGIGSTSAALRNTLGAPGVGPLLRAALMRSSICEALNTGVGSPADSLSAGSEAAPPDSPANGMAMRCKLGSVEASSWPMRSTPGVAT